MIDDCTREGVIVATNVQEDKRVSPNVQPLR
jgi:hypothetical protein